MHFALFSKLYNLTVYILFVGYNRD